MGLLTRLVDGITGRSHKRVQELEQRVNALSKHVQALQARKTEGRSLSSKHPWGDDAYDNDDTPRQSGFFIGTTDPNDYGD